MNRYKANKTVKRHTPAEVQAELKRLQEKAPDGLLKAEVVIKAAESKASVLHHEFEWDDSVAAHKYRLEQARELIRSFRIKLIGSLDPVPIHVSLLGDRTQGGGYRAVEEVISSVELKAELFRTFDTELAALCKRYAGLFPEYVEAMEKLRSQFQVRYQKEVA